ncbi:MAG: hypothetical protein HDT46_07710 [Ruminococcaceae bacterium]|nr:hypothetical protein [Oscillospiraceae bacterium]
MKKRIKAEINSGACPVWLSPETETGVLKMLQNFSVTFEAVPDFEEKQGSVKGPGEIPRVILRDFSRLVSKSDFEGAELSYSDDENWDCKWTETDDLIFSYSGDDPFKKGGEKISFFWRNFYTLASSENKNIKLTVEAYSVPGCGDGEQGTLSARLAFPAYIISFRPDNEKSEGIVRSDSENRRCVVSAGGSVVLKWRGAADFTDKTVLKKNGIAVTGSFTVNDSYSVKNITESSDYELSVTNAYRFPHSLTYGIDKTDWKKKGAENGIFETDIYSDKNFNSQIFSYQGTLYAYSHPCLYKKDESGSWESVSENKLYSNKNYSCHASYLHNGVLYCAGSIKDSEYFSFCRYDMSYDKWNTDEGCVNLPCLEKDAPICCGFAASSRQKYFYFADKGLISINHCNDFEGWGSSRYINAPKNTKLIGAAMIFRVDRFYVSMLCEEEGNEQKRNVYLAENPEGTEEFIMKQPVSKSTERITMLKTVNHLWIATDREVINCDKTVCDSLFYPPAPNNGKAWLGSDENNIFGIFPDNNLWVYDCR